MLKLVQIDSGVFDMAFDDPALADDEAAVATVFYAALCTDAEAPEIREPDRYERRGWWAAPATGSLLWIVRRQPLGSAARRETLAMVENALTGHGLTSVQVSEVGGSAGNVSSVFMQVTGQHNGRQFVVKVPL